MKLTKAILHEAACITSDIIDRDEHRSAYSCFRVQDAAIALEYIPSLAVAAYEKLAIECGATLRSDGGLTVFENAFDDTSMGYHDLQKAANNLRFDFLYLLSKAL